MVAYGRQHMLERPVALRLIVFKFLVQEGMIDPNAVLDKLYPKKPEPEPVAQGAGAGHEGHRKQRNRVVHRKQRNRVVSIYPLGWTNARLKAARQRKAARSVNSNR
jgi:hypothetical protein